MSAAASREERVRDHKEQERLLRERMESHRGIRLERSGLCTAFALDTRLLSANAVDKAPA